MTELGETVVPFRAGDGVLRLGVGEVRRLVTSLEPVGAHGLRDRAEAVAAVGGSCCAASGTATPERAGRRTRPRW